MPGKSLVLDGIEASHPELGLQRFEGHTDFAFACILRGTSGTEY